MYVSFTLKNPIISRATRKRSITCDSVTLRNVTAAPASAVREKTKSSLYNYRSRLATGQSPAGHWSAQCLSLSLLYCSSYVSPFFSSLSLPYSIAPSLVCVAMNNNNNEKH